MVTIFPFFLFPQLSSVSNFIFSRLLFLIFTLYFCISFYFTLIFRSLDFFFIFFIFSFFFIFFIFFFFLFHHLLIFLFFSFAISHLLSLLFSLYFVFFRLAMQPSGRLDDILSVLSDACTPSKLIAGESDVETR